MNCDLTFKQQLAKQPGADQLAVCFACGSCTAGCPISSIDQSFSPLRIMLLSLWGGAEELLNQPQIWQCIQCHSCVARCPQDARPADVIAALRQLALEQNIVSAEYAEQVDALRKKSLKDYLHQVGQL